MISCLKCIQNSLDLHGRLFNKNKERIERFKRKKGSRYIYLNKPDKPCFQLGVAYGDFKDLTKKTL